MTFLLSDAPSLTVCPSYGNQPHTGPLCAIVLQLIKTHNLLPNRNYIFGYHPHGIFCFGAFCNFGTEATGFSKKFPGIKPSLATLAGNFRLPVLRDYLMSGGEMIWEVMEPCNVWKSSAVSVGERTFVLLYSLNSFCLLESADCTDLIELFWSEGLFAQASSLPVDIVHTRCRSF